MVLDNLSYLQLYILLELGEIVLANLSFVSFVLVALKSHNVSELSCCASIYRKIFIPKLLLVALSIVATLGS